VFFVVAVQAGGFFGEGKPEFCWFLNKLTLRHVYTIFLLIFFEGGARLLLMFGSLQLIIKPVYAAPHASIQQLYSTIKSNRFTFFIY
jgi:hypothetical protein